MKLGILADTHGQVALARQAVASLTQAGAEGFVHCGDVGSLDVLDELAGWPCWFVWGNMDAPWPSWQSRIEALGLTWPTTPVEFTLYGKRIAVFHGHERAYREAICDCRYDYLLHGHTHQRRDFHIGAMRVINPGALHRVATRTVALLDLATNDLQFLELDRI